MREMAQHLGAMVVAVEHRFYGSSVPRWWRRGEGLELLTQEQARGLSSARARAHARRRRRRARAPPANARRTAVPLAPLFVRGSGPRR